MTYGHHPLTWVGGRNILQEIGSTLQQMWLTLNIVGPHLAFQVRNEASGKAAPVALAEQRGGSYSQTMRRGNDFGSLNGALQVASNNSINRFLSQSPCYLSSLLPTPFVKTTLRLTLHNL
jgi:hypothetical protein